MTMELDCSSLAKAVFRLSEGLAILRQDPEVTIVRDGVIQRFEFTNELAHKLLRLSKFFSVKEIYPL